MPSIHIHASFIPFPINKNKDKALYIYGEGSETGEWTAPDL